MPKTWQLSRKKETFITRPTPGTAPKEFSMPLTLVMRELIGCAKTSKEVKSIIKHKKVLVDAKQRWDDKLAVGLMDVVELPDVKEAYRLLLTSKGKLTVVSVKADEASVKPVKIIGKSVLGKDKVQVNLFGGKNIILKKDDYKVNDTLLLTLPGQKVKEHFTFGKGATIFLTGGKQMGNTGVVKEIKDNNITFTTKDGEFITAKRYAFVIGKAKSAITLTA